ncbi:fused MFS/spermidine synthase [Magnetovibrio sp.]|uniref:fused MFS/spermidine synthase n=1 Tax=Magnetovibrio sp. TaxID=2024836 RepID=UPI002F9528A4
MRQVLFAVTLLVSSACGLVIEIVAGRLLAPYVGMSLYTWTAIIAVVLAGLSVGHWIGGALAAPHVDNRLGASRVAWALALSSLSSLATLVLLREVSGLLLQSGLGQIEIIVLLASALFFLPSLFVGIVSPILTKLAVDASAHHPGGVIGRMFALGTLGSIAGTLLAGYLFISWIGSIGTVLMVAAVYATLAVLFVVSSRTGVIVVVPLVLGLGATGLWGNNVQAFTSPCTAESDYFCIRVDPFPDAPGARLMALDHLVHSINDERDPGLLYSPYLHFVDEYARATLGPGARSAYFIGGGGFTLPRAWAAEFQGRAKLVVAEIDPAVTRAATDHLWLDPRAPGLEIAHQDARMYLQSLPLEPTFDVVFGDAFYDISIPAHLVSQEFTEQIARRLNPNGFYAINTVDNGHNPRFLLSLARTLGTRFANVEVWAERGQMGQEGRVTFVVVASNSRSARPVLESNKGLERTWVRWPDADLRARALVPDVPVLTDDYAPVDRLMSGLLTAAEL